MRIVYLLYLLIFIGNISCNQINLGSPLEISQAGVDTINTEFYKRKKVDLLSVKSCEGCHEEETREWKASGHGRSWNNPVFKHALQKEPARWCVNCHAPLDKQKLASIDSIFPLPGGGVNLDSESQLTSEGINCAVCHVRDGKIYSAKKPTPSSIRLSIHPIEVDENLGKTEFCASCHEFPFPIHEKNINQQTIKFHKTMMQSTVSEFRNSISLGENSNCQSCHFRNGTTQSSFHGSLSFHTDLYPIQLSIQKKDQTYIVSLKIKNVGHVWPTGDYFRQIRIRILREDGRERIFIHSRTPTSLTEPKWGNDYRLHPKQSLIQVEYNVGESKPKYCAIEMHKQGGIQNLIMKEVGKKTYETTFIRNIYEGACATMNEPLVKK